MKFPFCRFESTIEHGVYLRKRFTRCILSSMDDAEQAKQFILKLAALEPARGELAAEYLWTVIESAQQFCQNVYGLDWQDGWSWTTSEISDR